ncbi:Peptidase family S41 [Chitinophaga eiseniae]|uniref:Peptidase family S41 n=1 Tax=Chitinophaga eiseniae TaxID=634771 RepID=A0A1T4T127_9BACT|nr:S41 family peptidase [Chitinophaga eiseniae]SKA34112.1 Peptidase family S41 [Chitinophaga eiseniae]
MKIKNGPCQPLLSLALFTIQPVPADTPSRYPAATVIQLIDTLSKKLDESHPGYYRYRSKSTAQRYTDSLKATITADSLTTLEIYRKVKPFVYSIGCLHTGLQLPPAFVSQLDSHSNLLPLQLLFDDRQATITKNYSADSSLLPGTVVTAINGKSIQDLLAVLLPAIPADGYNQTMKYKALYHQFPTWYRSMIGPSSAFTLTLADGRAVSIPAARFGELARPGFLKVPVPEETLSFTLRGKTAILTIRSFATSDIKRTGQQFRKYIDRVFLQLQRQGIQQLIVDLRGNTGGTDGNAVYFTRHFFTQPFRYWDRIEKAIFIGEETGGGYQGNTSGMMPVVALPPVSLLLTVPLQEYFNAVDTALQRGHGTPPDYVVLLTAAAVINGADQPMELALRLAGAK